MMNSMEGEQRITSGNKKMPQSNVDKNGLHVGTECITAGKRVSDNYCHLEGSNNEFREAECVCSNLHRVILESPR